MYLYSDDECYKQVGFVYIKQQHESYCRGAVKVGEDNFNYYKNLLQKQEWDDMKAKAFAKALLATCKSLCRTLKDVEPERDCTIYKNWNNKNDRLKEEALELGRRLGEEKESLCTYLNFDKESCDNLKLKQLVVKKANKDCND